MKIIKKIYKYVIFIHKVRQDKDGKNIYIAYVSKNIYMQTDTLDKAIFIDIHIHIITEKAT